MVWPGGTRGCIPGYAIVILGGGRSPSNVGGYTTPRSLSPAISAAPNPNSARISSVCSPASGGRRVTALGVAVDLAARHAGFVEPLDPMGTAGAGQSFLDEGIERVAVAAPVLGRSEARILRQLLGADRGAEALPDRPAGGGDVDGAIGRAEHAGRHHGRVVVAGLARDLAFVQPARRLEIQHEDLSLEQRGLDPLALARDLAFEQRHQDALGAEDAGGQIGDRDADPHRAAAGFPGDRHQPAQPLRHLVEARPVAIGPVLAEARDAGIDQARIDRAHGFVIDAEPRLDVGPEILDQHIGLGHQPLQHGDAVRMLEVERQAALVALQILEIRAVARAAHGLAAFLAGRRFDLDDPRPPIGQLAYRGRAGPDPGQVQDCEPRERALSRHHATAAARGAATCSRT